MGEPISSEAGRNYFWSLLDKSISTLQSSSSDLKQKEYILDRVYSVLGDLKDWVFLTHSKCSSVYVWLVQHFSQILLNSELAPLHSKISACLSKLVEVLASVNHTLFNVVLKTLNFILESILLDLHEIMSADPSYIQVSLGIIIPNDIKNKFPSLEVSIQSSFSSLFVCYYEMCTQNADAILIYGKCQITKILNNLSKILDISNDSDVLKIMLFLASKSLPLLTIKEWTNISSAFKSSQTDTEILHSFSELLELYISIRGQPEVHFLLFKSIIGVLSSECPISSDIDKWLALAINYVEMLSTDYLRHLDISALLYHAPSKLAIYNLILAYIMKSVKHLLSSNQLPSDTCILSEVDNLWILLMDSLNKSVQTALNDLGNCLNSLENIVHILSMALKMRTISNKYDKTFVVFNLVSDNFFDLFQLADKIISSSNVPIISNLIKLSKLCIFIIDERNKLQSECIHSLYKFLIIPWQEGKSEIWDELKPLCFESLVTLFCGCLGLSERSFSFSLAEILFMITSDDNCFIVLYSYALFISIAHSTSDLSQKLYCNFLEKCINPDTIYLMFESDLTRDILPCFFSGSCDVVWGEDGYSLLCVDCDDYVCSEATRNPVGGYYLNFVGFSFARILLKCEPISEFKSKLFKSLKRYIYHIPELRSGSMLEYFTEFVATEILKEDFDLTSTLKPLIFDDKNIFLINNATIVSKKLLSALSRSTVNTNDNWRIRFFDFLLFLSRFSKDFLWTSCKYLISQATNNSRSSIQINYMKQELVSALCFHKMDMKLLLIKYVKPLSKIIVDLIIHNIKNCKDDFESTVSYIALLFNMTSRQFLEYGCTPYMIAYILIICDLSQTKYLISKLSNILLIGVPDIIIKGFSIIYSTIYLIDDEVCSEKGLRIIESICECRIEPLVYFSYKNLICYIMMNSHKPVKVFRFFQTYAVDEHCPTASPAKILFKHAVGYLTFVDAKLSSKSSSSFIIRSCIRSISSLINILDVEYVESIRIKLLATLRTGLPLHYESYPKECLEAWMYFIHSIQLPFLGPYITTIFTLLKPLFSKYPVDISRICYYLVIVHGDLYSDYLPELFFIEDSSISEMHAVWQKVQESNKKLPCMQILQITLSHIKKGAVESRIHSLEYLFHVLKLKRREIYKMIHHSDQLPAILKEIVDCLMLNIHYGNPEVKRLCANCIGEIGAINPARFGYAKKNGENTKCFDIKSRDFAYFIILELSRSLQKSEDSHSYNTIASSIQEILKLYFTSENPNEINKFLEIFPPNESAILSSMLGSRYIFTESIVMKRKREKVGSSAGKNPYEWASSWASDLIALMPPETFENKVFKICLPAIKLDSEALEAILPHILLQTILKCSEEDKKLVEMEFKFILKFHEQNLLIRPQEINLFKSSSKKAENCFSSEITEEKCVSIILDIIDFLYKYLRVSKDKSNMSTVSEFLKKFPNDFISLKSYMLKDYCRSLFYWERILSSSNNEHSVTPLKNIYAKLNDADGLHGVTRMSNSIPTEEESMLIHIACGHVQDALPGYELLVSKNTSSTECNRALIQCYLNINSSSVALKLADSFFSESTDCFEPAICSELAEATWKNFMFHNLQDYAKNFDEKMKNNWSWSIDIGLAYLYFSNMEFDQMKQKINSIRGHIAERIAAISNTTIGTYRQGYNHIVNLQILNELEMFADFSGFINKSEATSENIKQYYEDLNMNGRIELLPTNSYFITNVINSRIQALSIIHNMKKKLPQPLTAFIENELGNSYLHAAKLARKNVNIPLAHSYLSLAEKYQPTGFFIEKAKLLKYKLETDSAICILKKGIQGKPITNEDSAFKKLIAQAKLLIARYNEENMNVDFSEGKRNYLDAITTFPTEENHRYLAQYLYNIHKLDEAPDRTESQCEIQVEAMKNFGYSLRYGCKYIYQSMFCIISLWLDFGTRFSETLEDTKTNPRDVNKCYNEFMGKLNNLMLDHFRNLPSYMFMAVFSQLLSRINHPLPECQQVLMHIISKIALDYPQQTFWMMAPLWTAPDSTHQKLFKDLFHMMKKFDATHTGRGISISKLFSIFHEFVDILLNICSKQVPNEKNLVPVKWVSPKLKHLFKTSNVTVMIPAQKFRTICLPSEKYFEAKDSITQHNPFPSNLVYFSDVEDDVLVLRSLQRPKKLVFRGSDGMAYPFMCKPMDDLRLDSRIMEFSSVINMFLQRDPASSDRNLHINTYSVVPLNHQNGLIEWVPNMMGMRSILLQTFEIKNISIPKLVDVKMKIESCRTEQEKLKLFEEVLLPQHPPVLHKWFFAQFPSPTSWYLAQKSFVRTAAVMSIVGYVVGLGDRHNDNVLIDTTTGEVMHVDYNCLFGRGEFLQVPEQVPFRLTQNIVKAMGSTGIEGHFMRACEITNRVIRNNSDQLLYVLKPFLYDFKKKTSSSKSLQEKMKNDINIIQKKMAGYVITPRKKTEALSVEGQVRCLIDEAMSHKNLSLMFYGWMPFL